MFGPSSISIFLSVRTAKALARLCGCVGSPEPSLVAYAISTIISWAGSLTVSISFIFTLMMRKYILLKN